jgi:predicted metal-dependent peptidase
MSAKDLLKQARAGLVLDHPFFASLALRLGLEENPKIDTASVNGKRIQYNPQWIESLTLDAVKGVICHEVMHCASQHHVRRDNRDLERWNVAADYVINSYIVDEGMTLPEEMLLDRSYDGMSAESAYNKLPQPDPDGDDEGEGGDPDPNGKDEQGQGSSDGDDKGDGKGDGPSDPGGCGAVEDGAESPAEIGQQQAEWKVAVAQAAATAKAMGDLSQGLDRFVKEIVNPKVDWRNALRRFVESHTKNDFNWIPPNRKYLALYGIVVPSLNSNELGKVIAAVDTSCSITDAELVQFSAELGEIIQEFQADCQVIHCDSKVKAVEDYGPNDLPLRLRAKGGGGTDFRPPFEVVDRSGERPPCMIYLTDGECNRFPDPPDYPVLWVMTGNSYTEPPFGEVVNL